MLMPKSWTSDLLILTLLLGLFFGFELGNRALWSPDEGRYSEVAREMVAFAGAEVICYLCARPFIPAESVIGRPLLQRQLLSLKASEPDGLHYGLLWQFERQSL